MRRTLCLLVACAMLATGCIGGSDAPTEPTTSAPSGENGTAEATNRSGPSETTPSPADTESSDTATPEGYTWENETDTTTALAPWPADSYRDIDIPEGALNFTLDVATDETIRIGVLAPSDGPETPCVSDALSTCGSADGLVDWATYPTHCCTAEFTVQDDNVSWSMQEPENGTWTLQVERPAETTAPSPAEATITARLLVPTNTSGS